VLATAISTWVAYEGVRTALESEFESRLERVAGTAASQIRPETIGGIQRSGEESADYGEVQVQLVTLRSATGVENATLIDSSGVVLVDVRSPEGVERLPATLDDPERIAFRQAREGRAAVSGLTFRDGVPLRTGFVPVRTSEGDVPAVVAIQARVAYLAALSALGRTLALITLMSALAIVILAVILIRASWSAAQLERRLSRAENLAAMGRLTATLAHEIKNPLAIIRGSAERLTGLDAESRRMATFVIEEADRLSRTVARYLRFARGDEEVRDSGDAVAALEATLELLEGEFRGRRVTLERGGEAGASVPVSLDNESLKQVYLNLVLNALEAMPEGGTLRVALSERHGRFEASFADSGPGIPPDILRRLGSPFYTTKAKGSGLGLFLTRRLVQAGGGTLEIQSEVGRGTNCTVRLPRRRA
jgi:signal transduction histidine kinase